MPKQSEGCLGGGFEMQVLGSSEPELSGMGLEERHRKQQDAGNAGKLWGGVRRDEVGKVSEGEKGSQLGGAVVAA